MTGLPSRYFIEPPTGSDLTCQYANCYFQSETKRIFTQGFEFNGLEGPRMRLTIILTIFTIESMDIMAAAITAFCVCWMQYGWYRLHRYHSEPEGTWRYAEPFPSAEWLMFRCDTWLCPNWRKESFVTNQKKNMKLHFQLHPMLLFFSILPSLLFA